MDLSEYQKKAHTTAFEVEVEGKIVYPMLGFAGETGEIANKVKKIFRDKHGKITDETREDLKKELGDALWYLAELATQLDISFDDIAEENIEKLKSRKERGVLKGGGDNR
ncbi:hypothetical protein CL629_03505 [bacterium]|nr:hypothetical protein [bacterium]|tara:strand:- start:4615 stop:4944 length:330 start_codon:yes stop_codon:yes gene_type:complete